MDIEFWTVVFCNIEGNEDIKRFKEFEEAEEFAKKQDWALLDEYDKTTHQAHASKQRAYEKGKHIV